MLSCVCKWLQIRGFNPEDHKETKRKLETMDDCVDLSAVDRFNYL